MMSAGRAAEQGAKVLLIEKNDTLGKKLLITFSTYQLYPNTLKSWFWTEANFSMCLSISFFLKQKVTIGAKIELWTNSGLSEPSLPIPQLFWYNTV